MLDSGSFYFGYNDKSLRNYRTPEPVLRTILMSY
jgi:hypothetical protein